MTRNQLIEEIVSEWEKEYGYKADKRLASFLRTSLIRISDASMDSIENELKPGYGGGWNKAFTASQEKRRLFVK